MLYAQFDKSTALGYSTYRYNSIALSASNTGL